MPNLLLKLTGWKLWVALAALLAATTFFVWWWWRASGVICPNAPDYGDVATWVSGVATVVAVVAALLLAQRSRDDQTASNRIRAAAHAGQVATELLNTSVRIMAVVGAKLSRPNDPPNELMHYAAKNVRKISIVALKNAAQHADVFDLKTAQSIGSLLGIIRTARTEVEGRRQSDPTGTRLLRLQLLIWDAAPRVIHLNDVMWEIAGLKGKSPIPTNLEKLRQLVAEKLPSGAG